MKTKMKNLSILFISILTFSNIHGQYCAGGPSSTFDSNVESVFINGDNNTNINYTGCPGIIGLEDQTANTVSVTAGLSYTLDVQFGTCGGNYNSAGEAWIDWNQNLIFEPNESIGTWSGIPPVGLNSFSFTVPTLAANGITNIRVMQIEGGLLPLDPCANFTWGSVVDFTANISGGFTATCPAPPLQFMTANNITSNSAGLLWTAGGTETSWNIEYGISGFPQSTGTVVSATTNPFTLTGLSPATNYCYYVQAVCSANDSSLWSGPYCFATACATVTAPYTEDFGNGVLPICWQQSVVSGDGWRFTGTPGYDAANNGRSTGTYAWIDFSATDVGTVMEVIPVDISNTTSPQIEFDFFCYNTTNPVPANILFVEANDGTNWVTIDSLQINSVQGWNPYSFSLVGYDVAGIVSVRFRGESGGATNDFYNDILVDNVAIREAPTCPSPLVSSFGVANLTATSAELSWLAGGNETFWSIEWGLSGFNLGTGTYDTTANFFAYPISGLTSITSYDFYVQGICGAGDTSYWAGPFTFTTPCSALIPSQLEDFSGGFPPNACWDQAGDGDPGTGPTGFGTSNWFTDGFGNIGTTGAVKINLYTLGKQEWILSPQYDFSSGGPFQIEFDFGVFGWNQTSPSQLGSDDRVEVLISRDGGASWNGLANYNNNYITGPNGNHEIIALPSDTTGIVQFAVWASEGSVDDPEDNDVMIDNFAVNPIPSCPQPQYISSFDITTDSASLTWATFGSDSIWMVYLTPSGVAPDSNYLTIVNNDTVTFSGLSSNTYYDFYVKSICSLGDTSFLTGPYSVLTNCLPISSPYFQNFDNTAAPNLDQCWSVISTGASYIQADNSNFNPQRSAPNSVAFYNSSVTSGDLILISPFITDLDSTKRVRFFLQNEGSTAYTSDLIVGTITDPNDPTTFTAYSTIPNSTFNSSNWEQIIVSFNNYSGTDNYIAFRHGLNSTFDYIWMDDFNYEDIPSCVAPTNLAASNITGGSADFSWTPGGNETLWNIQWGNAGFALGTGTMDSTSSTSYSLTGLSPSSAYSFYVQAICASNDSSYWTGPLNINTLIQGPIGVNCVSGGNPGIVFTDDLETQGGWTGNFGTGTTAGQWNVKSGTTSSTGTGPSGAHSGSNYFYYETSGTNPSSGSIVSPMIDLGTAADDAELSFWIHAYGAEIGTLNLGIGTSPTGPFSTVFSNTGQLQTSNAAAYQNVGINLGSYVGQQIYLEFDYTSGTSFTGDVAIDLIEVVSCISCASPLPTTLAVNSVSADSVNLSWTGSSNHSSWLVYLVPSTGQISTTTPIAVTNDTVDLAVSSSTTYNFYVQAICASGDTSIISGPTTFLTPCVSTNAPYYTDFDSGFPICWNQDLNDDFDWTLDASGTSSSSTGPSDDMTGGGNYMYIETSSPRTAGQQAVMYSESIDISSLAAAELRLFHHMYGLTTADLTIEISDDGGLSYNTIFTKSGDQGNQWNEEVISIAAFSGIVHFKVIGVVGSSFTGDIAIDNFEVREGPQNDVGIVLANLPTASTGCEVDSSIVTATIFNFGYLPQSGFTIQYSLNGTPFVETIFDTLQPGDSLLYTFTLPVDLTQDGTYSFDFTTNLPNDDNTANDAYGSTLTFQNYYTPIAPTVTDDTVCVDAFNPNGQSATLTASGPSGVDFDWFDAAGGFIGTGDTMTTDTITTTTSYFAAYQELAPGNMGATNNTFGGGGYYNFFTDGLMFDVYNDLTIDSVTIYPSDTGTVGIIIQSVLGSTIFNGTYTITAPVNTISGHKVPIGVNIPAGYAYGMYISAISPGTLSLYRNTTNASYPYDYGNIASITQASNGSTDFYFFFYNWDISTISCYSDMQEAVVYVDPCTNIKENNLGEFNISPNPNNGSFEIYMTNITATTEIEILDLNGKIIYDNTISNKNQNINIENISRGVYIVKANQNGNIKTKKLIIN